jgi:hypothetical protein
MRQLPALFSTEMVKALLQNRKTMTRRTKGLEKVNECPDEWIVEKSILDAFVGFISFENKTRSEIITCFASYKKGDHIYVRERFETETDGTVKFYAGNIEVENNTAYREITKWKPSIHMAKESARIWLKCTDVRCERLIDISESDAKAEGAAEWNPARDMKYLKGSKSNLPKPCGPFKFSFILLWCKINGVESFDLNPWVFVYSFKKLDQSPQSLTSPEKP